jgi:hypothetical protein
MSVLSCDFAFLPRRNTIQAQDTIAMRTSCSHAHKCRSSLFTCAQMQKLLVHIRTNAEAPCSHAHKCRSSLLTCAQMQKLPVHMCTKCRSSCEGYNRTTHPPWEHVIDIKSCLIIMNICMINNNTAFSSCMINIKSCSTYQSIRSAHHHIVLYKISTSWHKLHIMVCTLFPKMHHTIPEKFM